MLPIFDSLKLEMAKELDNKDPLARFHLEFITSDENVIYLDGNSLGRLPKQARQILQKVIDNEWGTKLIRSWNEGWYKRPAEISAKVAELIGAQPDEVIISDSTSVNLFKLAHAAMSYQQDKTKIATDEFNFPSDLYVFQGIIAQLSSEHQLEIIKSEDGISITESAIANALDSNTALLALSHVNYKSAFLYDMAQVTELGHGFGALMLWDLSHSVGVMPIELNNANVDIAVGCTYKYLNGGPGSPAFLYVRKDLQNKLTSPIWGWFGDDNPFQFDKVYKPADSIRKFTVGTPPILSISSLEPAIDMIRTAGIKKIREKSVLLTEYLIFLTQKILSEHDCQLSTPLNSNYRGAHVAIRHPEAYRICKALISPNVGNYTVIPDFRAPDIIRLGLSPLTTSFEMVYMAVIEIKNIIQQDMFKQFSNEFSDVT